jgi:hypothetical protein
MLGADVRCEFLVAARLKIRFIASNESPVGGPGGSKIHATAGALDLALQVAHALRGFLQRRPAVRKIPKMDQY